jgi:hypothetical protein
MNVYGADAAEQMAGSDGFLFKLIANESAVAFFPRNTEHRDVKQHGLSYEDDSAGSALAAMVKPGLIEFRFHKSFSDERVRNIAQTIINHPNVKFASGFRVTYQGKPIALSSTTA